jgi:crossover junction endodeoxyribonuclease RusA
VVGAVTWRVEVFVPGRPAPQGSKTYYGKGQAKESSMGLPGWRADVRDAVRGALPEGWVRVVGPVCVLLEFVMPRPKSEPRATRPHDRKPDSDKLIRAVFDAVTAGGLWKDDAQASSGYWHKRTAEPGEEHGVRLVFTPGC